MTVLYIFHPLLFSTTLEYSGSKGSHGSLIFLSSFLFFRLLSNLFIISFCSFIFSLYIFSYSLCGSKLFNIVQLYICSISSFLLQIHLYLLFSVEQSLQEYLQPFYFLLRICFFVLLLINGRLGTDSQPSLI